LKLFLSSFFLLCTLTLFAQDVQKDSIELRVDSSVSTQTEEKYDSYTQFRFGIDVAKLIASPLNADYNSFEFQFATNYREQTELVGEFAVGNGKIDNQFLFYNNSSVSLRFGFDRSFFSSELVGDRDNAFAGFRYGAAFLNRSEVNYTIDDPNWGVNTGTIGPDNAIVHWLELTGGFRMEIYNNVFLGWMIRGKTLINPKRIEELTPRHIAGYGNAEKQPAFDYNLWLSYSFGKRAKD